jgi:hypothetical protein
MKIAKAKKALESARHELVTLHGLLAMDEAARPHDTFYVDTNAAVDAIDDALKDFIEEEKE